MALYDANDWIRRILLDDENMTANSGTDIVSQRSIVAYVNNKLTELETELRAYIVEELEKLK